MGYRNESLMDTGYFMGGDPRGLIYFPPDGSEPGLIPWSELLPEDDLDTELEDEEDEEK